MAGKKQDSMLPEDSVDIDQTELRVNFSDEELASEARDFDPIPGGKYPCTITEWEMRRSTSEKHNGKPYWALRLRVNDDVETYGGRYLFPNVMLFEGALYSYKQLAEALGGEFEESITKDSPNFGKIPHGDALVGKEVLAVVVKKVDKYQIEQGNWDGKGPKPFKNDVTGFKPISAGAMSSGGSSSLMP